MERFEINKRDIVINRDDSIILLTKSLVERDEIAVPGAAILLKDVYYGRAKKINSCLPKMLVSVIDAPGVFEEVHCGDLEKLNFLYGDNKYDLMDEETSIVDAITEPIANDDEEKLILPAGFNFVIPDEVEESAAVVTPSEIEEATDAENAGEDIKEEVEETESQFATYAEEDIENELPSEDDDEEVEVDQENPDTNEHTQPHHKHKRKKNKK